MSAKVSHRLKASRSFPGNNNIAQDSLSNSPPQLKFLSESAIRVQILPSYNASTSNSQIDQHVQQQLERNALQKEFKNAIVENFEKLICQFDEMVQNCEENNLDAQSGLHADRYEADIIFSSSGLEQIDEHRQNWKLKPDEQTLLHSWQCSEIVWYASLESIEFSYHQMWLHLLFPDNDEKKTFSYTGAIMVNNPFDGLLYIVVRYLDNLAIHINGFNEIKDQLKPIETQLKNIKDSNRQYSCQIAIIDLVEKFKQLDASIAIEVYRALFEAQLEVYKFIQSKIIAENLINEGVTYKDIIQVNFRINDNQVMVVCVSNCLSPKVEEFDNRPIRIVNTVYLITEKEFNEQNVYFSDDCDESDEVELNNEQKNASLEKFNDFSKDQGEFPDEVTEISDEKIDSIIKDCEKEEEKQSTPANDNHKKEWLHDFFTPL